jgi:hypothetical protein
LPAIVTPFRSSNARHATSRVREARRARDIASRVALESSVIAIAGKPAPTGELDGIARIGAGAE